MSKLDEIKKLVSEYVKENLNKPSDYKDGDWVEYSGPHFDDKEYLAVLDVLLGTLEDKGKTWWILGEKASEFEEKFSKLMGKKYGTFTNSGSSANLLMMSALTSSNKRNKWKLEKGDRVITPVVCFPTTINPILQNGLEPVFVDVDIPSLNINLDALEDMLENWELKNDVVNKIHRDVKGNIELTAFREDTNPFPKAITFAHVLGNPPDMDRLMAICDKYNLIFLEDACDALGSTYDGKPLGTFGLISTCSFFPAHHMTTGEGGMVCTNEHRLKTTLNSFRDWGRACYCNEMKPGNVTCGTACGCRFNTWFPNEKDIVYDHRYVFDEIGYNLKPLELQAAIGLEQIGKLPDMEAARRKNHAALTEVFKPYTHRLQLQTATEKADPCWFGFLVIMNDEEEKKKIVSYLEANKIQTRSYFSGNIMYHPGYAHLADGKYKNLREEFPNAHKATTSAFFLGTFIGLTDEKISYIKKVVDQYFKENP